VADAGRIKGYPESAVEYWRTGATIRREVPQEANSQPVFSVIASLKGTEFRFNHRSDSLCLALFKLLRFNHL